MTSTKLLIYNCFIILLCSPDNNGVAGVFLIIWLFFFFCSLSRTSGNCGENNDCLPASSVSHGLHITNSLSATKSLIKEAAGLPFKADSIYTASHQRPSGSSVSNEQLVFKCLTQGLWQITISFCFCCTWITAFRANSHFTFVLHLQRWHLSLGLRWLEHPRKKWE